MTLKQHRRQAARNGHTGSEPADLRPRLPDDFPNETTRNPKNRAPQYPKQADKRLARRIARMLESTTVVQEVDRFLRNHPGRPSRISTKALLLGMVLAAYETGRYLRSDICSFLNGLDYRLGIELGLWTWGTRPPVTYTMTQKQIKRLETAIFEARWSSNGQPRSINWFMDTFLSDSIPAHARKTIITASLDWTPIPTYAVTRDYRIEEEVRKEQEPEDTGEIGTLDLRARTIRSADDDARAGTAPPPTKPPPGDSPATTDTSLSPPAGPPGMETPTTCPSGRSHPSTFPTAEPFPPKTTTLSTASTLSSSPSKPSPTSKKSSPIGATASTEKTSCGPSTRWV